MGKLKMTNGIKKIDSRNKIINLKLPEIILEFFDGNCTDKIVQRIIGNRYTDPYAIFILTKEQQDSYNVGRYIPLIAIDFETIIAYDIYLDGFVKYTIERFEITELQSLKWESLFVTEILQWWESEAETKDILYVGNLLGLKQTELILNEILIATENKIFSDFLLTKKWKKSIIDKIEMD